jgi:hypothetical protein
MRWERLFHDLEARLEAEERAGTESEVADLVRTERSRIAVRDRLRAHLGQPLTWFLITGEAFGARLVDVGADWVLVAPGTGASGESLIPIGVVQHVTGLSRFVAPEAGPVARRLGMGAVLRGLSRDRAVVTVRLRDGGQLTGTIDRVGVDHLDLAVHPQDEPRRERAVREVGCVLLSGVVMLTVRGVTERS